MAATVIFAFAWVRICRFEKETLQAVYGSVCTLRLNLYFRLNYIHSSVSQRRTFGSVAVEHLKTDIVSYRILEPLLSDVSELLGRIWRCLGSCVSYAFLYIYIKHRVYNSFWVLCFYDFSATTGSAKERVNCEVDGMFVQGSTYNSCIHDLQD